MYVAITAILLILQQYAEIAVPNQFELDDAATRVYLDDGVTPLYDDIGP